MNNKNTNFKNVRVGQRFATEHGIYVRIRPFKHKAGTIVQEVNAVMIFDNATLVLTDYPSYVGNFQNFGNISVALLGDDE